MKFEYQNFIFIILWSNNLFKFYKIMIFSFFEKINKVYNKNRFKIYLNRISSYFFEIN
jgi:hypothetical protein